MTRRLLVIGFAICMAKLTGQSGTSSDPFTSLQQATSLTTAGVYHFDLGTPFSSYVDEGGFVQIAIDLAGHAGALPQRKRLKEGQRGILNPTILASLTDIGSVRISSSVGDLDATTTHPELAEHIQRNQSLMSGSADNPYHRDWTGTGAEYLSGMAWGHRQSLPLHEEIFHPIYNGNALHWIPARGDQALTYGNEAPRGAQFTLWVRGRCTNDPVSLQTYRAGLCTSTVTVAAPTVTGSCGETMVGSTNDRVTFDRAGEYSITWTFTGADGGRTSADQAVVIESSVRSLPFSEHVEADSPNLNCWQVGSGTDDGYGGWSVSGTDGAALGSERAFYLPPAPLGSPQNDWLISPAFEFTTGAEYELSFFARSNGLENLRIVLLDASSFAVVQDLSFEVAVAHDYEHTSLLFEVDDRDTYRIAFNSTSLGGRRGLAIDEIDLDEYRPAVVGDESLLAGLDVFEECISGIGRGVNGSARVRVYDGVGQKKNGLMMEIDPNGNDLGDVTVEMTTYAGSPLAPFNGNRQLGRYFNIVPENGSGPYVANGGVKIRLYFRGRELAELKKTYGRDLDWTELAISHYDGPNTDCDISNSMGAEFEPLDVVGAGAYGSNAHYLEFYTTSFSEFGAYSPQAAPASLPVTIRDFTARERESDNELVWSVADEVDFSHYRVERSTDGTTFTELNTLSATQQSHYSVVDPVPAEMTYYRLMLVDTDGSFEFSPVVSVSRSATTVTDFSVFPVPTSDGVTVRFAAATDAPVHLEVSDAYGRTVVTKQFTGVRGANERELDLSRFPAGAYVLTLRQAGTVRVTRLVKR